MLKMNTDSKSYLDNKKIVYFLEEDYIKSRFPTIRKRWAQAKLEEISPKIYEIIKNRTGVGKKELLSDKRTRETTMARKCVSVVTHRFMNLHEEVVKKFINRDRTSVLYYDRHFDDWYEYDHEFKKVFSVILKDCCAIIENGKQEEPRKIKRKLIEEFKKTQVEKLKKENNLLKQKVYRLEKQIKRLEGRIKKKLLTN